MIPLFFVVIIYIPRESFTFFFWGGRKNTRFILKNIGFLWEAIITYDIGRNPMVLELVDATAKQISNPINTNKPHKKGLVPFRHPHPIPDSFAHFSKTKGQPLRTLHAQQPNTDLGNVSQLVLYSHAWIASKPCRYNLRLSGIQIAAG